jgi:uncharacterized protein (DUF488 family)
MKKLSDPLHTDPIGSSPLQADKPALGRGPHLLTVGHGTISREEMVELLTGAGVALIIDVRRAPGSRRHPQFGRGELEAWLPAAGVDYRWEADLGGFRRPAANSPNGALRHPSFRGYADYMATDGFRHALERVVQEASDPGVTLMCAETLWWRCHRRLIADAATLCFDAEVRHLGHNGRLSAHRLTEGVRVDGEGGLVYDARQIPCDVDAREGLAQPGSASEVCEN